MRTRGFMLAGLLAGAALFPLSAAASTYVVGQSLAHRCSEAADAGSALMSDVTACTAAIETESLDPQNLAGTYVNRGVLLQRLGRQSDALRDFNQAIAMEAHAGEAYVNRGAILIAQGNVREGLADTDRALTLPLREPEKAWFNRGVANERLGDLRTAYGDYRRAAELSPNWQLPRVELARFSVR